MDLSGQITIGGAARGAFIDFTVGNVPLVGTILSFSTARVTLPAAGPFLAGTVIAFSTSRFGLTPTINLAGRIATTVTVWGGTPTDGPLLSGTVTARSGGQTSFFVIGRLRAQAAFRSTGRVQPRVNGDFAGQISVVGKARAAATFLTPVAGRVVTQYAAHGGWTPFLALAGKVVSVTTAMFSVPTVFDIYGRISVRVGARGAAIIPVITSIYGRIKITSSARASRQWFSILNGSIATQVSAQVASTYGSPFAGRIKIVAAATGFANPLFPLWGEFGPPPPEEAGPPLVICSLALTQVPNYTQPIAGGLSVIELPDVPPNKASLTVIEEPDTLAVVGRLTVIEELDLTAVFGALSLVEQLDTLPSVGTVALAASPDALAGAMDVGSCIGFLIRTVQPDTLVAAGTAPGLRIVFRTPDSRASGIGEFGYTPGKPGDTAGLVTIMVKAYYGIGVGAELQQPRPPYPDHYPTQDLEHYLSYITSEHNQKPKYMETVGLTVDPFVATQEMVAAIPGLFDLDWALGEQLDYTGQWIGKSRWIELPVSFFSWDFEGLGWNQANWKGPFDGANKLQRLDDFHYRILLAAAVIANHWDGSIPAAYASWDTLFRYSGLKVVIQDYGDMTMIYGLLWDRSPDTVLLAMFINGHMDLKPEGVQITDYAYQDAPGIPFFGFDVQNDTVSGWDVGGWGILVPPGIGYTPIQHGDTPNE